MPFPKNFKPSLLPVRFVGSVDNDLCRHICPSALSIRVLYRLRSLSEQTPFDSATFSYIFPFLAEILNRGGVEGEDDPLEQVSLALDVIKFHCGECSSCLLFDAGNQLSRCIVSDHTYPRTRIMEVLQHVIRQQPRFTKEASSTLIDLGEAIFSTSTRDEIDVLLHGTLFQEVYVRNACLQSLQV